MGGRGSPADSLRMPAAATGSQGDAAIMSTWGGMNTTVVARSKDEVPTVVLPRHFSFNESTAGHQKPRRGGRGGEGAATQQCVELRGRGTVVHQPGVDPGPHSASSVDSHASLGLQEFAYAQKSLVRGPPPGAGMSSTGGGQASSQYGSQPGRVSSQQGGNNAAHTSGQRTTAGLGIANASMGLTSGAGSYPGYGSSSVIAGSAQAKGEMLSTSATAVMRLLEEVQVVDLGEFEFKGVSNSHTVMGLQLARLSGRTFATGIRHGKTKCVRPGKGVMETFIVDLSAGGAFSL